MGSTASADYESVSFAATQELVNDAEQLRPSDVQILDTEKISQGLNHNGVISSICGPTENGLHLKPDIVTHLTESGRLPHRLTFSPFPLRSLGRDNSRHGVIFGDLELHHFTPKSDETHSIAAKPANGAQHERFVMHEFAMNEYLGSLGISTFQQVGIWRSGQALFSLSIYEPQVITLDTVHWEELSQQETTQILERGIGSLIMLHSVGVFHGDSELKNLGIEPNLNSHKIIDTEYAVSIADQDPEQTIGQPNGLVSKLRQDLRQLCKSIDEHAVSYGSLNGFDKHYAYVLAPYRKILMKGETNGPYQDVLKAYIDTVIELLYAESAGDEQPRVESLRRLRSVTS